MVLGREMRSQRHPPRPLSRSRRACPRLHVEHAHLFEEHGAGRTALRQHEVVLADAQAREVDACTTADALLQATRAAEDRATQVECIAALAEREVGFLKSLNVCSPLDYSLSLSSLGSHKQTSY